MEWELIAKEKGLHAFYNTVGKIEEFELTTGEQLLFEFETFNKAAVDQIANFLGTLKVKEEAEKHGFDVIGVIHRTPTKLRWLLEARSPGAAVAVILAISLLLFAIATLFITISVYRTEPKALVKIAEKAAEVPERVETVIKDVGKTVRELAEEAGEVLKKAGEAAKAAAEKAPWGFGIAVVILLIILARKQRRRD